MSDAKHTPPNDPSFRRSLLRNVGGAIGLVVLVAAIFGVLGMIGRADPDAPPVASVEESDPSPEQASSEGAEQDQPAEESADAPESPPAGESTPEDNGEDVGETDEPAADPAEDPQGGGDEPEEPAAEEPPQVAAIDPAQISVQVLDGFRQDGGAAASAVASELEAEGYRIIARNPAIAYDVTTVLWTSGFEAEGRQVAAAIGAPEVREQPGNLSSQVNVHVVIGADRG